MIDRYLSMKAALICDDVKLIQLIIYRSISRWNSQYFIYIHIYVYATHIFAAQTSIIQSVIRKVVPMTRMKSFEVGPMTRIKTIPAT